MDGNRFYSIPYDARNDVTMLKLRAKHGGIVAFGRWQALLGMIFDDDGVIDINDPDDRRVVEKELELRGDKFNAFIDTCVGYGLLSHAMWQVGKLGNEGVCNELEFKRGKSEAGKKSAEARAAAKAKAENDANDGGCVNTC